MVVDRNNGAMRRECLAAAVLGLISIAPVRAQFSWQGVSASDGQIGDAFGAAVDLDGSRAAITGSDRVYVFESAGGAWLEDTVLQPSSPAPLGAVAVLGNSIAVVVFDPGGRHVAVFERSAGTWSLAAEVFPSDGGAHFQGFGWRMAFDGATLAVSDVGSSWDVVYVFAKIGGSWQEQAVLTSPNQFGAYGDALAVDGDTLVVGDSAWDTVYVYERTGTAWALATSVSNPSLLVYEVFGASVALEGDTLAVGAYGSLGAGDFGATFVFRGGGSQWAQEAELRGDPGALTAGRDTSLRLPLLLTGGYDPAAGTNAGEAYLFRRTGATWVRLARIDSGAQFDLWGSDLAVSSNALVIGEPDPAQVGVAWFYDDLVQSSAACLGVGCPCGNDDPGAGCANSTGVGASLLASGSDGVAADDLVLLAEGLPPSSNGLFFMGSVGVTVPVFDGLRCAGGVVRRFPSTLQNSGPDGLFAGTQLAANSAGLIVPGTTWTFQVWYRDLAGPCGTGANFSNAYPVTFGP